MRESLKVCCCVWSDFKLQMSLVSLLIQFDLIGFKEKKLRLSRL